MFNVPKYSAICAVAQEALMRSYHNANYYQTLFRALPVTHDDPHAPIPTARVTFASPRGEGDDQW